VSDNSMCVCCGSNLERLASRADAKSSDVLSIGRCGKCGLYQQHPMPSTEELEIYYSHNYRQDYKAAFEPKIKYVARAGKVALERLRWIGTLVKVTQGLKLLDVGAGGGEFVYCASQLGYDASGIEPNVGYSEFAKIQYGVEIRTAMLGGLHPSSFDVVTMFHVLEHMAKPREVSRSIYSTLKPGGFLVVEVPNILQLDASPHNIFFKAHLTYFSLTALRTVFSAEFDLVASEDKGNLKAIFQKREAPLDEIVLPSTNCLAQELSLFSRKGWITYLFQGRGYTKLLRNIQRHFTEKRFTNHSPKHVLDSLISESLSEIATDHDI